MESTFAFNLRLLRKNFGLNQEDLANILGKKKSIISNYESGSTNPGLPVLSKIAEFFGVGFADLLEKKLERTEILELIERQKGQTFQIDDWDNTLDSELDEAVEAYFERKNVDLAKLEKEELIEFIQEDVRLTDDLMMEVMKLKNEIFRLYRTREKLENLLNSAGY